MSLPPTTPSTDESSTRLGILRRAFEYQLEQIFSGAKYDLLADCFRAPHLSPDDMFRRARLYAAGKHVLPLEASEVEVEEETEASASRRAENVSRSRRRASKRGSSVVERDDGEVTDPESGVDGDGDEAIVVRGREQSRSPTTTAVKGGVTSSSLTASSPTTSATQSSSISTNGVNILNSEQEKFLLDVHGEFFENLRRNVHAEFSDILSDHHFDEKLQDLDSVAPLQSFDPLDKACFPLRLLPEEIVRSRVHALETEEIEELERLSKESEEEVNSAYRHFIAARDSIRSLSHAAQSVPLNLEPLTDACAALNRALDDHR